MGNTHRPLAITRSRLALLSVAWMVAVYMLWLVLHAPDMASLNMSQCDPLGAYAPYAYAECRRLADDALHDSESHIATAATLVAILPVAFLWGCWFALRFFRECSMVGRAPQVD